MKTPRPCICPLEEAAAHSYRFVMKRRSLFKLSFLGALLAGGGLYARQSSASAYYKGPMSDHFDGTRFFNPGGEAPNGFLDLMKWRFDGDKATWPDAYPSPFPS